MPFDAPGDDFTLKDLIINVVLPQLQSIDSKLDNKADHGAVEALQVRVGLLEQHGSPGVESLRAEVGELLRWVNRLKGAVAVLTFGIPLAYYLIHLH